MSTTTIETVLLTGGVTVPLPALQLVWALEDRGVNLRLDGDDVVARPARALTPEDVTALRTWKADVMRIVEYVEAIQ